MVAPMDVSLYKDFLERKPLAVNRGNLHTVSHHKYYYRVAPASFTTNCERMKVIGG